MRDVNIKGVWFFLMTSLFFFSMFYLHFQGDEMQVLTNGAKITDLIYYNSMKIGVMFVFFAFCCASIEMSARSPKNLAKYIIKYLSYWGSAASYVRVCFHFSCYDEIPDIEIIIDAMIASALIIRALHQKGKLKTLYASWDRLLRKSRHSQ